MPARKRESDGETAPLDGVQHGGGDLGLLLEACPVAVSGDQSTTGSASVSSRIFSSVSPRERGVTLIAMYRGLNKAARSGSGETRCVSPEPSIHPCSANGRFCYMSARCGCARSSATLER